MEKITNKTLIALTLIIIFLIIVIASTYKLNKNHKEKLYDVMQNKIKEQALKCYNEGVCQNETIYIKDLYKENYIETTINPLNNEYLNENSYVVILSINEADLVIID